MSFFMVIKLLLSHLFIALNIYEAHSTEFTVKNNCGYKIWAATQTGTGPQIPTGFELPPKASNTLTVTPPWSGRLWARTQCSGPSGALVCNTGDCTTGKIECNSPGGKPPASLVEYTLAGADQKDFYDISLVDGFNVPVSVQPTGPNCPTTSCSSNVNSACPNELALRGDDGAVIGCRSACTVFQQPQYCCTGSYGSPTTCRPTNYSMIFKKQCPQAYSYAYDDSSGIFTCPTGGNYVITFCP
ncbi:thaumatin-like protein 1 [Andrographis paniculata]|uniref:thaumatin-like protein 1 n=1 Tax=Andrographis paniculata TaxID=175694 RepID=UPI0021E8873F|nr:thaumatin-like protein 1 [Andrographis paniculata]